MKLTAYCYALLGLAGEPPWTCNAGIIAGATQTLIIDTGMSSQTAATIHGYATAVRPANRLMVINTEPHLDHLGGNSYFRNLGIEIYGHLTIARDEHALASAIEDYNACVANRVRRERREGGIAFAGTQIANPNKHLGTGMAWDLGQLNVRIVMTPGHTPANLSVLATQERVLYSGDCIVSDYLPNLEEGSPEAWRTWIESLDRITALDPAVVVPGHGQVLRGPEIRREIQRIRDILEEAISLGKVPTQA